jgi:2'-5' RNA ligase
MSTPPGRRHRIFIAAELDPSLRQRIVDLEGRIQQAGAGLRWIPSENLHFTVRFMGEISPAQLAQVKLATRAVAAAVQPFRLTLHGVGAFPSLARPQVVWVGVREGSEELADLSGRLDAALARHHFPREDRPYVAHLTLTRVRHRRLWGDVVRALSGFREVAVGDQQVGTVTVMESHLNPRGARYTRVEEVPLGQALKFPE